MLLLLYNTSFSKLFDSSTDGGRIYTQIGCNDRDLIVNALLFKLTIFNNP